MLHSIWLLIVRITTWAIVINLAIMIVDWWARLLHRRDTPWPERGKDVVDATDQLVMALAWDQEYTDEYKRRWVEEAVLEITRRGLPSCTVPIMFPSGIHISKECPQRGHDGFDANVYNWNDKKKEE